MPLVAMEDAQQCLQLDPSFFKAYHRLAAAHSALGRCGAYPAPPAPCAVPPCPEWWPPLGAPFASPPTPRRMPLSAVAHTRLGRSHEQRLATLTPTPTLSPPRALRPSLPGATQVLPRYAEASAVLRRALEREDVPAEAGMREELAEKLRQVDAQLQAQLQLQLQAGGEEDGRTEQAGRTGRGEAGREGRGGPEEAGSSATAPACTAPPCTAAESVAAAAAAAAGVTAAEVAAAAAASTAASAPSEPASSELAPVALRRLLALSDDLLLVCTARAPPYAPHAHRTCTAPVRCSRSYAQLCCTHHACARACSRACAAAGDPMPAGPHPNPSPSPCCRRSSASWAWPTCSVPPRAAARSTAPAPHAAATARGTGCARPPGRA